MTTTTTTTTTTSTTTAAVAVVVVVVVVAGDGVCTKSCQCDPLARGTVESVDMQRNCFSGTENFQSCL